MASTLNTIFPGNIGKLQMVRVMLQFNVTELVDRDLDEALDEELVQKLLRYKHEVTRG